MSRLTCRFSMDSYKSSAYQAAIRWSRLLVYYHLVNSNQIAIGNENTSAFVIDVRMNLAMIRYKSSSSSSVSDDLKPSDYHQNVM